MHPRRALASSVTSEEIPVSTKTTSESITKTPRLPQWREAVAGACAGALAKTVVAPIERVKLLLQLQHSQKNANYQQKSAFSIARTVYTDQGLLAFWRGNNANLYMQAGTAGLNFMLMDYYSKAAVSPLMEQSLSWNISSRTLEQRKRRRELIGSFISGGLAGGTATTVLYPVQFLRTRLAMDVRSTRANRSSWTTLSAILQTDGIRGLYQGYPISVAGVILYRALHLGGYDAVKTELLYYRSASLDDEQYELTWTERLVVAQGVSLTAGTICYPIDSVRRRLMMQAGLPTNERLYVNSMDCAHKILQTEGIRGFYLGLGPNLIRSLGAALLLVAYDIFKVML